VAGICYSCDEYPLIHEPEIKMKLSKDELDIIIGVFEMLDDIEKLDTISEELLLKIIKERG
jgi:hypothetical protein